MAAESSGTKKETELLTFDEKCDIVIAGTCVPCLKIEAGEEDSMVQQVEIVRQNKQTLNLPFTSLFFQHKNILSVFCDKKEQDVALIFRSEQLCINFMSVIRKFQENVGNVVLSQQLFKERLLIPLLRRLHEPSFGTIVRNLIGLYTEQEKEAFLQILTTINVLQLLGPVLNLNVEQFQHNAVSGDNAIGGEDEQQRDPAPSVAASESFRRDNEVSDGETADSEVVVPNDEEASLPTNENAGDAINDFQSVDNDNIVAEEEVDNSNFMDGDGVDVDAERSRDNNNDEFDDDDEILIIYSGKTNNNVGLSGLDADTAVKAEMEEMDAGSDSSNDMQFETEAAASPQEMARSAALQPTLETNTDAPGPLSPSRKRNLRSRTTDVSLNTQPVAPINTKKKCPFPLGKKPHKKDTRSAEELPATSSSGTSASTELPPCIQRPAHFAFVSQALQSAPSVGLSSSTENDQNYLPPRLGQERVDRFNAQLRASNITYQISDIVAPEPITHHRRIRVHGSNDGRTKDTFIPVFHGDPPL